MVAVSADGGDIIRKQFAFIFDVSAFIAVCRFVIHVVPLSYLLILIVCLFYSVLTTSKKINLDFFWRSRVVQSAAGPHPSAYGREMKIDCGLSSRFSR